MLILCQQKRTVPSGVLFAFSAFIFVVFVLLFQIGLQRWKSTDWL